MLIHICFRRYVLENYKAAGLHDMGGLKWELSVCLMFVFIVVYFSLWKGIKGSGKVVDSFEYFERL